MENYKCIFSYIYDMRLPVGASGAVLISIPWVLGAATMAGQNSLFNYFTIGRAKWFLVAEQ